MSSPVPDGTDFWAGKSGIWLIISFCNSLQLWINLGKGNSSGYVYYHYSHLWRKHILISDSWFLLPFLLFLLSTSVLYSILSYKCIQWVWSNLLYLLFKCGIWLLFPVLQLYFRFFKISMVIQNNGLWELRGEYQFCHCCLCFYIIDYLNRFLLSKLSYTDCVPFKLSEVPGILGYQLSAFLQVVLFFAGRLPNVAK